MNIEIRCKNCGMSFNGDRCPKCGEKASFEIRKSTPKTLSQIIEQNEGGIYKRISENQEVLQAILEKAPKLISKEPSILFWIKDTDKFLNTLASIIPHNAENCIYSPGNSKRLFRVNGEIIDFESAGENIQPHWELSNK